MSSFRAEMVDDIVWQWLKDLMQHPDQLAAGLRAERTEAEQQYSAIRERISLIDTRLADTQGQQERLLDLYLQGDFPKEVLTERKVRLETELADLSRERADLAAHYQTVILSDEQIAEVEAFCAEVRNGLDNATFEDKRRYFELLDMRGRLAIENDERVIYAKCKLGAQRLAQVQTSLSSSNHNVTPIIVTARLVVGRAHPAVLRRLWFSIGTDKSL